MQVPTGVLVILAILLIIGVLSLYLKIYLQIVIGNPSKRGAYFSVFTRIILLTDFLPLRLKYKEGEEKEMRKKANMALLVFYACVVADFIIIGLAR
jgi:hypothetical protein